MDCFNKDKVFWTKSMNIDLVKYLEDKPYIWNKKDPQFTNVSLRDETFANFAAKYNNEFPWTAAKDRWTNIRSAYGAYMRKLLNKRAKGEEFKVNWFLWGPCRYLQKVYRKGVDIHKYKRQKDTKIKDNMQNCKQENEQSSYDEGSNQIYNMEEDSNPCESVADNLLSVFRHVQNNSFCVNDSKIETVGETVTKTLSELSPYDAAQASIRIMQILAKYEENSPLNPNHL